MSVFRLSSSKPILSFKISGTLTRADLGQLQTTAIERIEDWGKVSALVILNDFLGWEKGAGLEDMFFAPEHDRNIEKIAIVGPEQWRDLVYAFAGKGFRPAAIEYFLPSQLETAKKWLSQEASVPL